jgi:hypothetical protein
MTTSTHVANVTTATTPLPRRHSHNSASPAHPAFKLTGRTLVPARGMEAGASLPALAARRPVGGPLALQLLREYQEETWERRYRRSLIGMPRERHREASDPLRTAPQCTGGREAPPRRASACKRLSSPANGASLRGPPVDPSDVNHFSRSPTIKYRLSQPGPSYFCPTSFSPALARAVFITSAVVVVAFTTLFLAFPRA